MYKVCHITQHEPLVQRMTVNITKVFSNFESLEPLDTFCNRNTNAVFTECS